jgi:UDP-N-acetylglucosamine 3-dehydrogenase
MSDRQLSIGIIGLGEIGQLHARAFAACERARLVAVADLSTGPVAQAQQQFGVPGYDDHRRLLDDPSVEAVVICLPHDLHFPVGTDALERGRHVLMEKPLALDIGQAGRLVDVARASGITLAVGHNQLFYPPYRRAKAALVEGSLGSVRFARFRLRMGPRYPGWRTDVARTGGGALFDAGVHRVYLARYLFGTPVAISAIADVAQPGREFEEIAVMTMRFAGDVIGVIEASHGAPRGSFDDGVEIVGDSAVLLMGGAEATFHKTTSEPPYALVRPGQPPQLEAEGRDWAATFEDQALDFVDAVLDGRRPNASGEDGRDTIALIEAAYESARSGRVVRPVLEAEATSGLSAAVTVGGARR